MLCGTARRLAIARINFLDSRRVPISQTHVLTSSVNYVASPQEMGRLSLLHMDCIIFLFDQVSSWPSAVQVYFKPLNANCHKIRGEGMECSLRGLQNEWLRRPWPWFDEEPGSGSKQVCSLVGADPSIRGVSVRKTWRCKLATILYFDSGYRSV